MFLALAQVLLHILGAAGESLDMDRLLMVNTRPVRARSLYHEGEYYDDALLTMKPVSAAALLARFDQLLRKHPQCCELFAML